MKAKEPSASLAYVPPNADLDDLVRAARSCRGCHLYERATQTVFGEGPVPAPLFLVGEQPGDQEDKQGRPFVGPAGRVLDEALAAADIPRDYVYLTNVVKHFKWEPRGKRRIHSKPNALEVHACNGWLQAEVRLVRPRVIVCLGATAAHVLLGRTFRLLEHRGQPQDGAPWAPFIIATYHPSALLRMIGDPDAHAKATSELEADLATARSLVIVPKTGHRRAVMPRRARPHL